jgi:hypothetical protein
MKNEADEAEYVSLVASYTCGSKSRERVRSVFIRAFGAVFPNYGDEACECLADLMSNEELMVLFDGTIVMSQEDIEVGLKAGKGYSEVPPRINQLRSPVADMSREEQGKFLRFAMAREALPVGWLRKLAPPLHVVPLEVDSPDTYFPISRTCTHMLCLPCYSSREILKEKILTVLDVITFGRL